MPWDVWEASGGCYRRSAQGRYAHERKEGAPCRLHGEGAEGRASSYCWERRLDRASWVHSVAAAADGTVEQEIRKESFGAGVWHGTHRPLWRWAAPVSAPAAAESQAPMDGSKAHSLRPSLRAESPSSLAVMHPWPATIKLPPRAHPLFSRPSALLLQ
jgi:hypothetical protein